METKNQSRGYSAVLKGVLENALSDYEDATAASSGGTYRCRDCGLLFDTLEAHDRHLRQVHHLKALSPLSGMST
ncbi:MAG: hypothetical protein ACQCN6_07275 [Candidatus Bathyarchaeia archaeon]